MPGLNLDSVKAKLARAEEHDRAVQAEHAAWVDLQPFPYELVRHVNADFTRWHWIVRVRRDPNFERFAILFGDFAHNLVCALDHLVYAIAMSKHCGPHPFDGGRHLYFPISHPSWDMTKFGAKLRPLLGDDVVAAIRAVQPDRRHDAEGISKLAILRDVDIDDKHRLVRGLFAFSGEVEFLPKRPPPRFVVPTHDMHKGPFHDGTELAWFCVPVPAPAMDPDVKARFALGFAHEKHRNPASGRPWLISVTGAMRLLIDETREVIRIVSEAAK